MFLAKPMRFAATHLLLLAAIFRRATQSCFQITAELVCTVGTDSFPSGLRWDSSHLHPGRQGIRRSGLANTFDARAVIATRIVRRFTVFQLSRSRLDRTTVIVKKVRNPRVVADWPPVQHPSSFRSSHRLTGSYCFSVAARIIQRHAGPTHSA